MLKLSIDRERRRQLVAGALVAMCLGVALASLATVKHLLSGVYFERYRSAASLSDPKMAEKYLKTVERLDPTDPKPPFLLGEMYERAANDADFASRLGLSNLSPEELLKRALSCYRLAVQLAPFDAAPRERLGWRYAKMALESDSSARELALRELRRAVVLDPTDGYYRYSLGMLLQTFGDETDAIREYNKAMELDSSLAGAVLSSAFEISRDLVFMKRLVNGRKKLIPILVGVLIDHDERELARMECLAACLAFTDQDDSDQAKLLEHLLSLGEAPVARFYGVKWLERHESNALKKVLARALFDTGDVTESVRIMLEVIQAKPLEADNYITLGEFYEAQNQLDRAYHAYKTAIRLRPEEVRYRRKLIEFQLRRGKPIEAIESCRAAIAVLPTWAHGYYLLGCAYLDTGNRRLAADAFSAALRHDPKNQLYTRALAELEQHHER